jgi:predicted phosphodiesterase
MPLETLDALRERGALFVRGNADRVLDLVGANTGETWVRARHWVAKPAREAPRIPCGLPLDLALDVGGLGRVRFCHGAHGSDEITRLTPEKRLRKLLAGVDEDVVVCGHTHVQFDRVVGGVRVANAGSVGAPYKAEPAAYWALLGPEVDLRRADCDVEGGSRKSSRAATPRLPRPKRF